MLPSIIPAQIWVVRYNSPANGADEADAIAVDSAGNIYVTGRSYDPVTSHDYVTVKYNSSGVEQWVARYNGPINYVDWAFAIAVDGAGNVYITGDSYSSVTNPDYATVKYDSSGVEQWVVRYDGPGNYYDHASAIAVDNAGNVYVTGWSYSTSLDITTVKYDSSGVELWVARHDGPMNSWDYAYAIAIDPGGSIYVTGESAVSDTFCDYVTVKYDSSGVEQWVVTYDGPAHKWDIAYDVALDNTGNVYITGTSRGSGTTWDYATVKYDSSGVEQWVARYDGPINYNDHAHFIAVDNIGNVYVTGSSFGVGDDYDYATLKYDASGIERWVARYNGSGYDFDLPNGLAVDNEGNVYVTGESMGSGTSYDYATVKYDTSGIEQWVVRYDGPVSHSDGANAIAIDNAGDICVTGSSYAAGTEEDYTTIKYSSTGLMEYKNTTVEKESFMTTFFHGPLQLPEGKKCKVFDITGRGVEPDKITRGIYFVEIDNRIVQKVVKVR
jgi:uncharacterized delta-60 repeat protein